MTQILSNGLHSGFASELDTVQWKCLQNFSRPTEDSVLSRAQMLRWFKAVAEGRESIEVESHNGRPSVSRTDANVNSVPGSCACRSSVDSQNDWDRVEFESQHHSSDIE